MSLRQVEPVLGETMDFALAVRDLRRARWLTIFGDALLGSGASPLEAGEVDTLDQIASAGVARMFEISEGLQIDASTATRAVDRLVRRKLVDRGRDPEDGRFTLVWLTGEGKRVHEGLLKRRMAFVDSVLDRFDETDRVAVIRLLPMVADAITVALTHGEVESA